MSIFSKAKSAASSAVSYASKPVTQVAAPIAAAAAAPVAAAVMPIVSSATKDPVGTAFSLATRPDQAVKAIVVQAATGTPAAVKTIAATLARAAKGDPAARHAVSLLSSAAKELVKYAPAASSVLEAAGLSELDHTARAALDAVGPSVVAQALHLARTGDVSQIPQRAAALVKSSMASESWAARYAPLAAGAAFGPAGYVVATGVVAGAKQARAAR